MKPAIKFVIDPKLPNAARRYPLVLAEWLSPHTVACRYHGAGLERDISVGGHLFCPCVLTVQIHNATRACTHSTYPRPEGVSRLILRTADINGAAAVF